MSDIQMITPEPWRVVEPVALDYRAPRVYGANGESLVAYLEGGGPKRAVTAAEARANAFLIAAAPDLLQALTDLIGDSDDHDGGKLPQISAATLTRARQAIAKARSVP